MPSYLMGLDETVFRLTNAVWTSPLLDAMMPALSWAGNLGAVWLVLLGAIAAFGRETGRKIALAGLVALVIGVASSEIIKEITTRPRPFSVLPNVGLLIGAPDSYAFPSGHTTSAFAAAGGAALAARRLIGKLPAWGWGMLALAAAMAYSRLYVGVHWPTDAAAGVVLGLASGWVGARLALRRRKKPTVGGPNTATTPPPMPVATPAASPGAGTEDAREVEYGGVMHR